MPPSTGSRLAPTRRRRSPGGRWTPRWNHHLAGHGGTGDRRGRKGVPAETGKVEREVPRDRRASFDPQLIAKYQRRFPGFDGKIVSMYARGMSTREIVGHLRDL